MPGPHPPEFRRRAVELAREVDGDGDRRYSVAQLSRELGISESCLRNWLAADEVETGDRPGLTKAEREELVRLRRENRVLRAERDLLSRAAAFFAQENVLPPGSDVRVHRGGEGHPSRDEHRRGVPHVGGVDQRLLRLVSRSGASMCPAAVRRRTGGDDR